MKYICTSDLNGIEEIFIFPVTIDHDLMAMQLKTIQMRSQATGQRQRRPLKLISAGFIVNGECHGRSETLDLDARAGLDTALLRKDGSFKGL